MSYQSSYLRSRRWARIKQAYWQETDKRCAVCGSEDNIDLHHCSYERIGREQWGDLIPLCRSCHEAAHTLINNGQASLADAHLKLGASPENRSARFVRPPTQMQADPHDRYFYLTDVPIFEEATAYTSRELDMMATAFLYHRRARDGVLLTRHEWYARLRHEIWTPEPDPSYFQDRFGNRVDGMYWRTHPDGLPWADAAARREHNAGFYSRAKSTGGPVVAPRLAKEPSQPSGSVSMRKLSKFSLKIMASDRRRGEAIPTQAILDARGTHAATVAKRYGVSRTTVYKIWREGAVKKHLALTE